VTPHQEADGCRPDAENSVIRMGNHLRLSKISTVDAVVNYIKDRIEGGIFKPGDKLPSERLLQKELAVSRFTLREALARLGALGIIKTLHGKGTIVAREMNSSTLADAFIPLFANQSIKDIIDFFEARVLIEGEAAVLSARRRSDEDLKHFEAILSDSRQAINDPDRYGESSGNVFLQNMMGCMNEYTRRYMKVLAHAEINRIASIAAHEEMYACIKDQDTGQAGTVTRKHLSRMLAIMEKLEAEQKIADSGGELSSVLDLLRKKEGIPMPSSKGKQKM
jgi:GntR family transcriptional regulator, transcriptional repressor for pyruvate dehydrogenase complex